MPAKFLGRRGLQPKRSVENVLNRQIRKCEELLQMNLSEENLALVRVLHADFKQQLAELISRMQTECDHEHCA